jgi:hypothetical protein
MQNNAKKLTQKQIDHFITLIPNGNSNKKYDVFLHVHSYQDLLGLQKSLLNVCCDSLVAIENNVSLKTSAMDIYDILEIIKDLIPFPEAEYLDEIANTLN